jgi:beta-galactosidase GanA
MNTFMFKAEFCTAVLLLLSIFSIDTATAQQDKDIPHLRIQGTATQLVVNGKPFLMLGGELGNSSASDLEYLKPYWNKFHKMHLNTILAPVYWELMEPQEGMFDYTLVDGLIKDAKEANMKLVLLWFGTWKNSMSCYAPAWVKTNLERFPRAQDKTGKGMEILTAFNRNTLEADKKAFVALMKHVRSVDRNDQTVIMVQVENEIGHLPDARDYCHQATELFQSQVPTSLMTYLQVHKETLTPELKSLWQSTGYKTSGSWEEVLGKSVNTDEVFMAWQYSIYVNEIAAAGKAEYPLPMYVNAALIRNGYLPGQYPSAGPLPHIMDIWRAGGTTIDFFSPDIYFPNFSEWATKFHRPGNPLFIPEATGIHQCASHAFYAFGQHEAMGFSPFSIESLDPETHRLTQSYSVLQQLAPVILQQQGRGTMAGVLLDKDHAQETTYLGNYILHASFELNDKYATQTTDVDPRGGGLIMQVGPDEFIVAGTGIIVTFESQNSSFPLAGFLSVDEGKYVNGTWVPGRRLNGDQDHQGRHIRLSYSDFEIQRVKLYQYK